MSTNVFTDDMIVGEKHIHSADHATVATNLGTSVASAVWVCSDETVVAITNPTVVSNEPMITAEALQAGFATLTCTTTLADTQVIKAQVHIKVTAEQVAG